MTAPNPDDVTTRLREEDLQAMIDALGEDRFAGIVRTVDLKIPFVRAMASELLSLRRQLAERDAALKPFAQIGETMTAQFEGDNSPWVTHGDATHYGNQGLTVGDFRRARSALGEPQ